jgi:hypothetical protein
MENLSVMQILIIIGYIGELSVFGYTGFLAGTKGGIYNLPDSTQSFLVVALFLGLIPIVGIATCIGIIIYELSYKIGEVPRKER